MTLLYALKLFFSFNLYTSLTCILILNISNPTIQSQHKQVIISNLSDNPRDIKIAKSDCNYLHYMEIPENTSKKKTVEKKKTNRLEICKHLKIDKMRIQTKKDLKLRRLAIKECQFGIKEH